MNKMGDWFASTDWVVGYAAYNMHLEKLQWAVYQYRLLNSLKVAMSRSLCVSQPCAVIHAPSLGRITIIVCFNAINLYLLDTLTRSPFKPIWRPLVLDKIDPSVFDSMLRHMPEWNQNEITIDTTEHVF